MVLGGLFWLHQAVVSQDIIPWWVGGLSIVLALANWEISFLCLYTVISFIFLACVLSGLDLDGHALGQTIRGMYYFLGFGLAFAATGIEPKEWFANVKALLGK
jgi:hypothetical protein